MRKRKTIVAIVLFVAAAAVGAVLYFNRAQSVHTVVAERHEFTSFIEGAGYVNAPLQVVAAPASGLVEEVCVLEGQHVNAGDIVLRMDDEALLLQLEEAVLALNAQKKEYLRQNGALSQSEKTAAMLAAQTAGYDLGQFNEAASGTVQYTVGIEQVDLARLRVRQAREMLENATVRAAISGTVMEVTARAGELLAAGGQAALLASMGETEILCAFSDSDASAVSPGMEVQLYGGCLGQSSCTARVEGIERRAETKQTQAGVSSMAAVRVKPDDPSLFTRLGSSVELRIITGKRTGVSVPIEALAQDDSGLYVFTVRRGRAYRTDVEVGVLDDTCAEMRSGVALGDEVALNPTELRSGMKVSP